LYPWDHWAEVIITSRKMQMPMIDFTQASFLMTARMLLNDMTYDWAVKRHNLIHPPSPLWRFPLHFGIIPRVSTAIIRT
jgi:hypothetical protein